MTELIGTTDTMNGVMQSGSDRKVLSQEHVMQSGNERTVLPQEHQNLDYFLAQIPRKAQKGVLTQCDLILTCVDATKEYLILGTNVGLLFLFDRTKEIVERLRTNSNSDIINSVSLHSGLEHQVAAGTHTGVVHIFQLPSLIPGQNKKLQQFVVKDMHKSNVTCVTWSRNGMKVFSGDDSGVIVCTEFDAYQGQCKSVVMLIEGGSEIVQLSHAHKALLVSTKHRSFVYRTDVKDALTQVGQKERKITGKFGACFIPSLCKPEDAQLYAVRPGMRIWKAAINGSVITTYLFKELIKNQHPEIPILAFSGAISNNSLDQNFGPLHQYMEKFLVTWNETGLFILNPEDNCLVATQRKIGSLVDVSVTGDEIFVLRKNSSRNLVRIALYPEAKGDSLYHKLISEREKFGLLKKPVIQDEEGEDTSNKSSPLQFLHDKLKSLDVLGTQTRGGNKPVESLISSIDKMTSGDQEEITDHELDHSGHTSRDHIASQLDISPAIKRQDQFQGQLPPVVKLQSLELPNVELFTGCPPINSEKQISPPNPATERFNPFLKDNFDEDIETHEEINTDELKSRGGGFIHTDVNINSVPEPVKPAVTEERLFSVVDTSAGDDIVFKSKKHKKKKKGARNLERGNVDKDNISYLSQESITASPDSLSIASETSDDISLSGEQKHASGQDDTDSLKNELTTCTDQKEIINKKGNIKEDVKDNDQNESYSKIEKSLEEFEKSIPGLFPPSDTKPREDTSKMESVENSENGKVVNNSEMGCHLSSEVESNSTEKQKEELTDVIPSDKGKNNGPVKDDESFVSIYSIYKSPKQGPQEKDNACASSVKGDNSETTSSFNDKSRSDSIGDDFYSKYASGSSSSTLSPIADVKEHPLLESDSHSEDRFEETEERVKTAEPSDEVPSNKLINNWLEVFTVANIECLALSENHIWYVDRSCNINYSSLHGPSLKWNKVGGYAKQIAVSKSGHIVWRLYKDTVYAASKVTTNKPEGIKWMEAAREVQSVSVDDTSAWYIKTNYDVMMQKELTKARPCFKSIKVACSYQLKQIVCRDGVVWAINNNCQLVCRNGITKYCPEGKDWTMFPSSTSNEMLFSSVTIGDGNIAWAIDILGRIWFMTSVTMDTPLGDGIWWQVPVSEILIQDMTAIDALRSLAKKFDPQKLASLLTTQRGGVITAGTGGIWVCPEFKNVIQVCRGSIEGHHWQEYHIMGIASSVAWKLVSASSSDHAYGAVWATQPNGEIFTFTDISNKCIAVSKPKQQSFFSCMSTCKDAMWGLTHEGKVYIRSGISSHDPHGVEWVNLDLMQLGDVLLISIACSTLNVWAVDSDGVVYQRIGVKAPSSHSLNPAWLPVDINVSSGTTFIHIAAGPEDYMVWAIDNRRQVYTRVGITDDMPIGKSWLHVPGTPAIQLTVSEKHVWALNPGGEILCRYGISPKNPGGDYWRKIPGVFAHISASPKDQLWAISREGHIFHRKTKYISQKQKKDNKLLTKRSKISTSSDDGWELL